jgi:hypothetical protein
VSSPRTLVRRWSSRVTEAWRSTLSWMRWRRRRSLRRAQERELLLEQLVLLLEPLLRQQLLAMAQPLSAALLRQDSLLLEQTQRLEWKAETAEEILLELLQAQPTPGSQMREELGIQSPT